MAYAAFFDKSLYDSIELLIPTVSSVRSIADYNLMCMYDQEIYNIYTNLLSINDTYSRRIVLIIQ